MDMNGPDAPAQIQAIDEPGTRATDELLFNMRKEVASLLGRSQISFPGAQPVSFSRKHIDELRREDYYVCEKSDGMRYLLYMTSGDEGQEVHYFIDRKNDYWYIDRGNLHFPLQTSEEQFHTNTILDGELVIDTLPDGTSEPRFLVFDCLALDGQVLMSRDLNKRLGYFQEAIFRPYQSLMRKYPSERAYQPFFVAAKDMQLAYGIEMMFKDVIRNLRHGNDGLIFTCLKTEYRPGTDPHILKWKDADENTVDFIWKFAFPLVSPSSEEVAEGVTAPFTDYEAVPHIELLARHEGSYPDGYKYYADLYLEESEWEILKSLNDPLDERVVEAYMDGQKRWRFYRFRDDKTDGNHISVVNSVIESIRDGVTQDELITSAKTIRDNWKAREAAAKERRQR
ncbi:mRNA capping enzyme [Xylariaceae sp. FL1272]|nr:mRNA capping enzyme [Xylariaceae sp. FL1272]